MKRIQETCTHPNAGIYSDGVTMNIEHVRFECPDCELTLEKAHRGKKLTREDFVGGL